MRSLAALLLLATPIPVRAESSQPLPTRTAQLALDDILRRTIETMERKPERMVCRVDLASEMLDGDGKPNGNAERTRYEELRQGRKVTRKVVQTSKNGKGITDTKNGTKDDKADMIEPFSMEGLANYRFAFGGQQTLWGRTAYLVRVTAIWPLSRLGNGTAWIDAQSFYPLKGEYTPAKLPSRVDWIKVQVQYAKHATGIILPSLLDIQGAGHFLFIRRGFQMRMNWNDCHG